MSKIFMMVVLSAPVSILKAALYTIDPRSRIILLFILQNIIGYIFFLMRLNACFNEMAQFRSFAALLKGCSSYGRNECHPTRVDD